MAYTLANLRTDIRNYTEVDDSVLSDSILDTIIKNTENKIYREADSDDNRFYATSNLVTGSRYVTIPTDLRIIRYIQLKDSNNKQVFLEKRDTSFMSEFYDAPATQSGIPKYYANWDAEFWVVAPTPDSTYEITLAYVKQPISITNTTTPAAAPAATAGTYISNIRKGVDKDGRLRSGFNIHGTTSGRLSSSGNLNYQNIPRDNKDIKKLFRARPGYKIIQCDLGTAEVYYAAMLSGDQFLQKAFIDKLDFHSYVAKQMFNLDCDVDEVKKIYPAQRQYAKAITFGIMYQAGPAKIAETVNKDAKSGEEISIPQSKQFINKYFSEAKALKKFIDGSNSQIENHAFIYSFFGRKLRLPEAKSPNPGVSKHAIRSGVNFLVQSVASDINILGVVDLIKWIEDNDYLDAIKPFTVVHDSIVSEVREDLVDDYIENARKCIQIDRGLSIPNCPIKVDFEIGPSWGELEDL